jgi:hypothetical protein
MESNGSWTSVIKLEREKGENRLIETSQKLDHEDFMIDDEQKSAKEKRDDVFEMRIQFKDINGLSTEVLKYLERTKGMLCCKETVTDHYLVNDEVGGVDR